MQSMTGYASKIVEIALSKNEKLTLSLHIKTLNARYFELTCKLPSILTQVEIGIHRVLKKMLERGHVYLMVKIQHDMTRHVVVPSESMMKEYMTAIEQIKKVCAIKESVSLQTLLTLPNIFQIEDDVLSGSAEEKIVDAVQLLAQDLIKTRKAEGVILAQDVASHIQAMIKKLHKVEKLSVQLCKDKKKQLDQVIEKLEPAVNDQRSVQQCMMENQKMVLLSELEKIDISEEISRASIHAKTILKLMKSSDSVGKKLDFIVQELNREINTMASKCSSAQISSLAIDMKTDIEKAREQVQNIL